MGIILNFLNHSKKEYRFNNFIPPFYSFDLNNRLSIYNKNNLYKHFELSSGINYFISEKIKIGFKVGIISDKVTLNYRNNANFLTNIIRQRLIVLGVYP